MCIVSVIDAEGVQCFAEDFPSEGEALDFLELQIDGLLDKGAKYIVVSDNGVNRKYLAEFISDCIFAAVEWSGSVISGDEESAVG